MSNPILNQAGALQVQLQQNQPMPLSGQWHCNPGELLALVGPSGSGKTSILRCLAGLMQPSQGHIQVGQEFWLDTQQGICLSPQKRHVGLVFQNYALMPHLSALDNVALAMLHLKPTERLKQARKWLDHVRLLPDQQNRRPADLSGGQQQRVAVARALAREPRLLLLDEPFSAVDQMNRQGLYDLLADLRQELHIPIILVTHDLNEARQLADKILVLDAGVVLQQGSPEYIYRSPRNARVADLLGIQNRFKGIWLGPLNQQDIEQQMGCLEWVSPNPNENSIRLRVKDKKRLDVGQTVTWVIQGDGLHLPNETHLSSIASDSSAQLLIDTCVNSVKHLGETTLANLTIDQMPSVNLKINRSGPQRQNLQVGKNISLLLACDWVHVMPTKTA